MRLNVTLTLVALLVHKAVARSFTQNDGLPDEPGKLPNDADPGFMKFINARSLPSTHDVNYYPESKYRYVYDYYPYNSQSDYSSYSSYPSKYEDYSSYSSYPSKYQDYASYSSNPPKYEHYSPHSSNPLKYEDYSSYSSKSSNYEDYSSYSSNPSKFEDYSSYSSYSSKDKGGQTQDGYSSGHGVHASPSKSGGDDYLTKYNKDGGYKQPNKNKPTAYGRDSYSQNPRYSTETPTLPPTYESYKPPKHAPINKRTAYKKAPRQYTDVYQSHDKRHAKKLKKRSAFKVPDIEEKNLR